MFAKRSWIRASCAASHDQEGPGCGSGCPAPSGSIRPTLLLSFGLTRKKTQKLVTDEGLQIQADSRGVKPLDALFMAKSTEATVLFFLSPTSALERRLPGNGRWPAAPTPSHSAKKDRKRLKNSVRMPKALVGLSAKD